MGEFGGAPVIVVLVMLMVAACIDLWRFRMHYVITFPLLLSTVAYQNSGDGVAGLQQAVTVGFAGTWVLLLFLAVGGTVSRIAREAPGELQEFKN
jgi:prepilin signal peptidase PulO-like enzyme (type II secretory pathway)